MSGRKQDNGLNPKQRKFVAAYLAEPNGKQAAIKAGYSARSAEVQASRLLSDDKVRAALDVGLSKQEAKLGFSAEDVLNRLWSIGSADLRQAFNPDGQFKPIHELPDGVAHALSGIETEELTAFVGNGSVPIGKVRKLRLADKNTALGNLAKHFGLLIERVDHTHRFSLEQLVEESEGEP